MKAMGCLFFLGEGGTEELSVRGRVARQEQGWLVRRKTQVTSVHSSFLHRVGTGNSLFTLGGAAELDTVAVKGRAWKQSGNFFGSSH